MKLPPARFCFVALLGALAPLWWTWAVSQLAYAIYVASGSPPRVTTLLRWTSMLLPALVLGIATGAIVAKATMPTVMLGWLAFFGSLVVASVALGIYFEEPLEYLEGIFSSRGNWFFFVGSLVVPGVIQVRRRRQAPAAP